MLAVWLALSRYATTWVDAKSLMLTSPVVVLLAWGASPRCALQRSGRRRRRPPALLALALAGGVLASDALQYHSSNLAPTARYEELASLNGRFAGRGPALFTDFDEYALYELRDLDVGGPDFVYPPPALGRLAGGYGHPVELDRASPAALRAYPLIVTRRDPTASRPPAAYRLLWQGTYYQVWGRRSGAPAAIAHVVSSGGLRSQCSRIGRLARLATAAHAQLLAAPAPELVRIVVADAPHPAAWGHQRQGLVMTRPGRLSAAFALPRAGVWNVWLQGQLMASVGVSVDGRSRRSAASSAATRSCPTRRRPSPSVSQPGAIACPSRAAAAASPRATAARPCSMRSFSRPRRPPRSEARTRPPAPDGARCAAGPTTGSSWSAPKWPSPAASALGATVTEQGAAAERP